MNRKILSLVFAAAMLLGTATMTWANDWDCFTISEDCGPYGGVTAYVCGDTWQEQQQMLEDYYLMFGC